MSNVNAICTSCNALLYADETKEALICNVCGEAFVVKKAMDRYLTECRGTLNDKDVTVACEDRFLIENDKLIKYEGGATKIFIPNTVTVIGKNAFKDCTKAVYIKIPNSVRTIEDDAFSGCTSIKSLVIPQSVTSLGKCAFENCTSLESITMPNGDISIGSKVFYGCTSLTKITVSDNGSQGICF